MLSARSTVGVGSSAGCAHQAAAVVPASVRRHSSIARAIDPSSVVDVASQVAAHLPAAHSGLLGAAGVLDGVQGAVRHLPLAYEPVALPCSLYRCGDLDHRSTLDLALRGEEGGPDWRTWLLLASVGAYLMAPPGVLPGAIDYYLVAKLRGTPPYSKEDVTLGRKLATGGFGTVFLGEMTLHTGEVVPVIVKKAKQYGQAEAWMNERMMRLPGGHCAEFIAAFDESLSNTISPGQAKKAAKGKSGPAPVWLVWRYEGDNNLYDLMESKEFPYNLEPLLLDRELRLPKGVQRKAITIKVALKQMLEALAAAHSSGIVHRDMKPQNCIISERDKKLKLIDLGAAADLRVGINYVPNEYLLDPRYAPPQQYIMSTQTPQPPPAPVAAFLSPVLWQMEHPDRFDMWACGVTLLQMAFPPLRNDNGIIAFNRKLESLKWDLRAWRREEEGRKSGLKPEMAEGFELLDMDGGAGWKLVCSLMEFKPSDRCTASEALLSPFFTGLGITAPTGPIAAVAASQTAIAQAAKSVTKLLNNQVFDSFVNAATGQDRGSLTEAQLREALGDDVKAPRAPRRASSTIVWWKERQNQLQKSLELREGSQSTGLPMKGDKTGTRPRGGTTPTRSPTPPPPAVGRESPVGSGYSNLARLFNGGEGSGYSNGNGKVKSPSPRMKSPAVPEYVAANGSGNGNGKSSGVRLLAGLPLRLGRGGSEEKEGARSPSARSPSPQVPVQLPQQQVEQQEERELVGLFSGFLRRDK